MTFPRKFIIYRLRCQQTGKSYVGFTIATLPRRWSCHVSSMRKAIRIGAPMTYLWKAINKYGVECWKKEELFSGMAESMDDIAREEKRFIMLEGTMAPNGYNLTEGGEGCVGCIRSVATRDKLRQIHLGMKASDETRKKMKEAQAGRIFTEEHRSRLSSAQMGARNHRFGTRYTEEERKVISERNSREGNPFFGRVHSMESIKAMRRHAKPRFGTNNHAARAVTVGDKRFDTMSEAAKFVGLSLAGMHRRVNSPKWSDCKYVEVSI